MPRHELLDLIDEHDAVIGQMDKVQIHDEERLHRDVHVFITNGTDMLQQQRSASKALMPMQWDVSVGGHVGHDQTYLEAGMRETEEEAGLHYAPQRFMPIGKLATTVLLANGKKHRTFGENFVVVDRGLQLEDIVMQTEEVMDVRWYNLEQMAADLRDPETAKRHAVQPLALWRLGIMGCMQAIKQA